MKKPFSPSFLPIKISDKEVIDILRVESEARSRISAFSSILERSVIMKEILIAFSIDESIQSTKIEGTQVSFSDIIDAQITGDESEDIIEVKNYIRALFSAKELLRDMPISTRMLLNIHEILLDGSRGQNKDPGSYRKVQNYIGPTTKISDATYIPPEAQKVQEYMSNLEEYINAVNPDDFGALSRTAIIHGQFETIHPFLDGNGRVGRLLIIIYLLDKGIISEPSFFVSEELEKNKYKYYSLLNGLRSDEPKWYEWIMFFLESAIKQADGYIEKLKQIEELYDSLTRFVRTKNINPDTLLFIFNKPAFTIKMMKDYLGISYNTARRYTHELVEHGVVFADDKTRNKVFRFYDLISLL